MKKAQFEALRDEKVQELESQLRENAVLLAGYRKEHGKLEVFFDKVLESVKPIKPLPIIYTPQKDKSKSKSVAVIHNSDWHTGEVQDAEEIEFINSYSPEIQQRRVNEMDRIFLRWVDTMRNDYMVNEARVICTGDMISNDIHRELVATNAYPPPVQVAEAARMFSESVATKAQAFQKVVVDYIVPDNHSRLTVKPQSKEAGLNSLNYLVAIIAKQYLSKHQNVDFRIHKEAEKVIDVNGVKYLCAHGNALKSWMGTPWYSIERHIGKESKARQHIMMQDIENIAEVAKRIGFSKFLFGHFHTFFNSGFFGCCGSLSGTSAYDHQSGRFDTPGQSIWLVHEKHGELNHTCIKLGHIV